MKILSIAKNGIKVILQDHSLQLLSAWKGTTVEKLREMLNEGQEIEITSQTDGVSDTITYKKHEASTKPKPVTQKYLDKRKPYYAENNWSIPKWIFFSETMLKHGWKVKLHEASSTVSKYVYIEKDNTKLKIRFSNHKANWHQEHNSDSDYYVGRGNKGVITTEKLIDIILKKNEVSSQQDIFLK